MIEREDILISVEHRYVMRMLSGLKKVELRRRAPRVQRGTTVWIYSKSPQAVVTAVARIGDVFSAAPVALWGKCSGIAGISKQDFDAYFAGATLGWAIYLEEVKRLPKAVTLASLRHKSAFQPTAIFYAPTSRQRSP